MMHVGILLTSVLIGWVQSSHNFLSGTNLAISGEAQQSSVYSPAPQFSAATAIDGIEETNIYKSPCVLTNRNHEPWWRLDLKKRYKIRTVVIVNRGDCCSERLKGAQIRVGNSPDNNNPVCATITDVSRALITVFCHGMVGRYVSVVIPGRAEYLTLCEVEVYGMETPNLEGKICW
uniref:Fucolectin tachylectin-4 pentraxin-1 domain-containing protein n=1 Tax=Xenopus tropicalis TaxID=8364 RepID=L7N3E3_XENTR